MVTSPLTSTPSTVATMAAPSSRCSSPSTSSSSHSLTHLTAYQPNRHQQQHIANPSPSFHSLNQPDDGLTFESSGPRPHDLSPVQSQNHLVVGQAEVPGQHSCMWANCHATFGSLQDLVAHVNVQHLQTVSASLIANDQLGHSQDSASAHNQSALNSVGQVFPSCHWRDCHIYPTVENVPGSSDRPLDAALGVLAAHLWEYHLGLPIPPPQFNFPSPATSSIAQNPDGLAHSSPLGDVALAAQISPVEGGMTDVVLPTISPPSVAAEADQVTSLTQDQDHVNEHGHDCATADHPCKWMNCQGRFASCEALTAHITAEHVGGGKNHYGCFWDGCARNGENGFKSKQKICRHLQVRSP